MSTHLHHRLGVQPEVEVSEDKVGSLLKPLVSNSAGKGMVMGQGGHYGCRGRGNRGANSTLVSGQHPQPIADLPEPHDSHGSGQSGGCGTICSSEETWAVLFMLGLPQECSSWTDMGLLGGLGLNRTHHPPPQCVWFQGTRPLPLSHGKWGLGDQCLNIDQYGYLIDRTANAKRGKVCLSSERFGNQSHPRHTRSLKQSRDRVSL